MKKVDLGRHGQEVLSNIAFYLFRFERQIMKRDMMEFSFFISFSNSLNMKKTSSFSSLKLVKILQQTTHHHDENKFLLPRACKIY